jgi:enoyl-CoA hydratase
MVRPSVRVEWRDRVAVVTIDRPERRNAVDHPTLLALADAQREAADGDARVLVLTGARPAFCAGADLTGVESGAFVDALVAALSGFTRLGIVTMAAVDGPALGAGTQLAIACDVRVATTRSVFGIPAAKLGLAIDRWTIERATRELGWGIARGMLLTAETYARPAVPDRGRAPHRRPRRRARVGDDIAAMAPLTIAAHKLGLEHAPAPTTASPRSSRTPRRVGECRRRGGPRRVPRQAPPAVRGPLRRVTSPR